MIVEIREPGRKPRRVPVTARVEVGRDCRGLLIHDEAASRRHVTLTPGPDGLFVTDLGSSNGTFVNGEQLTRRPARIGPGDVVRVGDTEISIPGPAADPETVSAMVPHPETPRAPAAPPAAAPAVAPAVAPAAAAPPPLPPARPPRRPPAALSLDERTGRRLAAAHGWVEVEVGGVEWSRFVESVIDAGLEQLPAVIARLRAEGGDVAP